jgi:hypothetical protein
MSSRKTPILRAGTLTEELRPQLERIGVIITERGGNRLRMTLPPGWRHIEEQPRRATWLDAFLVLDAKGRQRMEILYDHAKDYCCASLRLLTRYTVDHVYFDDRGSRVAKFTSNRHTLAVLDADTIVQSTPIRPLKEQTRLGYKDAEVLHAWIAGRFPQWQDPTAYWD